MRAKSPSGSTASTSPRSSTMPVNIRALLRYGSGGRGLRPFCPCPGRLAPLLAVPLLGHGQGWLTARVLPPIRTLTVGTGIPPDQPAVALAHCLPAPGRVADCNRRLGVSPTPEHA